MANPSDFVICLDNAHGKGNVNGSPYTMYGDMRGIKLNPGDDESDYEYREWEYMREIVQELHSRLIAAGYTTFIVVPEEKDIKEGERVRRIQKRMKKDPEKQYISISFHSNASGDGSRWRRAYGWCVYAGQGSDEITKKSEQLAQALHNAAIKTLSRGTDGIFEDGIYYSKSETSETYQYQDLMLNVGCPCVVTKNFFHTSPRDVYYYTGSTGFDEIVKLHFIAIKEYINNAQGSTKASPTKITSLTPSNITSSATSTISSTASAVTSSIANTAASLKNNESTKTTDKSETFIKFVIKDYNKDSGLFSYAKFVGNGGKGTWYDGKGGKSTVAPGDSPTDDIKKAWENAVQDWINEHPDDFNTLSSEIDTELTHAESQAEEEEDGKKTAFKSAGEAAKAKVKSAKAEIAQQVEDKKTEVRDKVKETFKKENIVKLYKIPVETAINQFKTQYIDPIKAYEIKIKKIAQEIKLNRKKLNEDGTTNSASSAWELEAKINNLPGDYKILLQYYQAGKIVKDTSKAIGKGAKATVKDGKALVKKVEEAKSSPLFKTPAGKTLLALLSALLVAVCSFIAAMVMMDKLDEVEAEEEEKAVDEMVPKPETAGDNDNPEKKDVVEEKADKEEDGFSKKGTDKDTTSKRPRFKPSNDSSSKTGKTSSSNADDSAIESCSISLCDSPYTETAALLDDLINNYTGERPNRIVIEFDKKSSCTIIVKVGTKVRANDVIGYVNGQKVQSNSIFTVTEVNENYIIGDYVTT